MSWIYPTELVEVLAEFGLAPTAETPPALLRDALNDLYRYELRTARDRLRAGDMEKSQYLDVVVALRKKYWLLSFQLPAWEKICEACTTPVAPDPSVGRSSGSAE
jgi:hypothetical protein